MPPLPPLNLNLNSEAKSGASWDGAGFSLGGAGDWNVNLGGSGLAVQGAGGLPVAWILGGLALAYFLSKK